MTVSGHCAHPLPLTGAGIDGLEHLDGECGDRGYGRLYDDIVALYRAAGIWAVPTIVTFAAASKAYAESVIAADSTVWEFMPPLARMAHQSRTEEASREKDAEFARDAAMQLYRAGVVLATGTDLGYDGLPNAVHIELEELVKAGLTPMEAIVAGTNNAARVLGASKNIGLIDEGMLADLVILDADPLVDIRNTRKIWAVVKGGAIVDRASLRADLVREIPRQVAAD